MSQAEKQYQTRVVAIRPSLEQVAHWNDQQSREALDWVRCAGVTDPKELEAYEAGLRQGFLKAYQVFTVHGFLKGGAL